MAKQFRKYFMRGLVLAIVALLGFLFYTVTRPPPPLPSLPNPNGYDDFVKAGEMLTGHPSDYFDLNQQELGAMIAKNAEAFKRARLGLSRECRVPISHSDAQFREHFSSLAATKQLALALSAEGKLAELEKRLDDALKSYLDCIRLGLEAARGGLIVDKLSGVACEALGVGALQRLKIELDAKQCREAVQELERLDARNERTEDLLKRDRKFERAAYGFRGLITRLLTFKIRKALNQKSISSIKNYERRTRVLMLDLAARACELEKGERPKTITDLVPTYLKTIPLDPFTGTNIVYQP